ncbi:family 43 glycosylhydrolase [Gottfriedia sp. OAE603]|uniref:family 43 glycosylhydrolase n=1 Tax=Gottfriedia sp. OAE603 TaxID=2663872 RepID=UPI00178A6225
MTKTKLILALVISLSVISFFIYFYNKHTAKETYVNPVFEPVLADPSIIKGKDQYFYAYGTQDDWNDGKGNRYVPIIKSKDLVNWDYVGEAFKSLPIWKEDGGIWAPDISYFNDQYYLYYSVSTWGDENPGIGVAVSDKPEGPFEDKGKLFLSEEIGVMNSIDPMLYVDNGIPYLFWGSFHGIYGIQLSPDGTSTVGEKFNIAGSSFEAPYIIKKGNYYYFFGSIGRCCEGADSSYTVLVARSKQLKGPYLDQDGKNIMSPFGTKVVTGMNEKESSKRRFVGPGHNAIIQDDEGTDWLVYHAIDVEEATLNENNATRRPLMIDKLIWNNGWPHVKNNEPSTTKQPVPVIK